MDSIVVIGNDNIEKAISDFLEDIREESCLSDDDLIQLMRLFNWNKTKLRTKLYDDMESVKKAAGISDVPKVEGSTGYCMICCMEMTEDLSLKCGHSFCVDCWSYYLSERLKIGRGAIESHCQM